MGDFVWNELMTICLYKIKHPSYHNENHQLTTLVPNKTSSYRFSRVGGNSANQEDNYPHPMKLISQKQNTLKGMRITREIKISVATPVKCALKKLKMISFH